MSGLATTRDLSAITRPRVTNRLVYGAIIQSLMNTQEDFSDLYTRPPISHSEEYPDVPVPDAALSPHLLAADVKTYIKDYCKSINTPGHIVCW